MTRRLRLPALAIAGVLAVGSAAVATASSTGMLRSDARSTVTPAPKPRIQKPKASALAQIKALQKQIAKAKADVKALKKSLAKADNPAQRAALKKSLVKAEAKLKGLEKALASAKSRACATGYRLVGTSCVSTG